MRQAGDYSAAPILADALEEAGFGDHEVLTRLREGLPHWQAECLVALIYSDKTNAAVRRIEEIAVWLGPGGMVNRSEANSSIPMDYQRLMLAAHDWVDGKEGVYQWNDDSWERSFPDRAAEFWENYHIVTGRKPADSTASFFVCSC
jgi:hypothetical protein